MTDTPRPAADTRTSLDPDTVRAGLDHEHRLVLEAILLVSTGGAPRVTVAGLHYPEQVIDASAALATACRVRLIPLWTDDEHGADVAVEAIVKDPR